MHYTGPDVPRLTGVDWFPRRPALQHGQIAFNTIGSVKARMSVKTCIHLRREFDEHYHGFVFAVRNVESFEDSSGDWVRHDMPDLQCACTTQETYQEYRER